MTIKKAGKSEVRAAAEILIGELIAPLQETVNELEDALMVRLNSIEDQIARMEHRLEILEEDEKVALLTKHVDKEGEIARARLDTIEKAAVLQHDNLITNKNALHNTSTALREQLAGARARLGELSTTMATQGQRLHAAEQTVKKLQEANDRILHKVQELEDLSIKNHSDAIREVTEKVAQAVVTAAKR